MLCICFLKVLSDSVYVAIELSGGDGFKTSYFIVSSFDCLTYYVLLAKEVEGHHIYQSPDDFRLTVRSTFMVCCALCYLDSF